MKKKNKYVLIMAGGSGTRFWPISTSSMPKQFLDILSVGKTLLQQTIERFLDICPKENIYVITNKNYKKLVKEQLPFLKENQILLEPEKRNTAPCIAYGCFKIHSLNKNAQVCVTPSDHYITDNTNFIKTINEGFCAANKESLITIGVSPTRADTGYGYIKYIKSIKEKVYNVSHFTEKPNKEKAQEFLNSDEYLWNTGIFIWNTQSILKEFKNHEKNIYNLFKKNENKLNTKEENIFLEENFKKCTNISIDYAIMEKSKNVKVILSSFNWTDLGTWGSLYNTLEKDNNGNAIITNKLLSYSSKNNIIVSNKKIIVLEGLEDYILVENNDALLICRKKNEQKIKDIVKDVMNL